MSISSAGTATPAATPPLQVTRCRDLPHADQERVDVEADLDALRDLGKRVAAAIGQSVLLSPGRGAVEVSAPVLTDDLRLALEPFAGEAVCIVGGIDPASARGGPQPDGGPGWRLLAIDGVATPRLSPATEAATPRSIRSRFPEAPSLEIATTDDQFEAAWATVAGAGYAMTPPATQPPAIDFEHEIAIFGHVGESGSCPTFVFGVEVEFASGPGNPSSVFVDTAASDYDGDCTDDFNPMTWVVAVERSALPGPPLTITAPGGADPLVIGTDLRLIGSSTPSPQSSAPPDPAAVATESDGWFALTTTGVLYEVGSASQPRSVAFESEGPAYAVSAGSTAVVVHVCCEPAAGRMLYVDGDGTSTPMQKNGLASSFLPGTDRAVFTTGMHLSVTDVVDAQPSGGRDWYPFSLVGHDVEYLPGGLIATVEYDFGNESSRIAVFDIDDPERGVVVSMLGYANFVESLDAETLVIGLSCCQAGIGRPAPDTVELITYDLHTHHQHTVWLSNGVSSYDQIASTGLLVDGTGALHRVDFRSATKVDVARVEHDLGPLAAAALIPKQT